MLRESRWLSSRSSASMSCGVDVFGVVVRDTLQVRDLADGADRGAADLAHALGNGVGHGEDLIAVLVEQQMVIAEMRPAHVPVEILRLEVQREHVGQQRVERARNIFGRFGPEIIRSGEWCPLPFFQFRFVRHIRSSYR